MRWYGLGDLISGLDCAAENYKGAVWVLQGGVHLQFDVEKIIHEWIDPLFNHTTFKKCRQLNKLKVVWITSGSQS